MCTHHEENYCTKPVKTDSCLMSSVALEGLRGLK